MYNKDSTHHSLWFKIEFIIPVSLWNLHKTLLLLLVLWRCCHLSFVARRAYAFWRSINVTHVLKRIHFIILGQHFVLEYFFYSMWFWLISIVLSYKRFWGEKQKHFRMIWTVDTHGAFIRREKTPFTVLPCVTEWLNVFTMKTVIMLIIQVHKSDICTKWIANGRFQ